MLFTVIAAVGAGPAGLVVAPGAATGAAGTLVSLRPATLVYGIKHMHAAPRPGKLLTG